MRKAWVVEALDDGTYRCFELVPRRDGSFLVSQFSRRSALLVLGGRIDADAYSEEWPPVSLPDRPVASAGCETTSGLRSTAFALHGFLAYCASRRPMTEPFFVSGGKKQSEIDVKLSYRIIQLFSEGLYSSPNKAVEELVSNAFDAGAINVHVMMSADMDDADATIVVVDDGEGMGEEGLKQHWIIGESNKRGVNKKNGPKGRAPIGKFGIGKLATYVLASRLTHVTKTAQGYFAASMDFSVVPTNEQAKASEEQIVHIPLRSLSEAEAKEAVGFWNRSAKAGYPDLFGPRAAASWTVAIMSHLKDMAREITPGRLGWVLATGMPLRNDFKLFLNGERLESSKVKAKRIEQWILGKDLTVLPQEDDLEVSVDENVPKTSPDRFGLIHPQLGRVTGTAELFEDLLTQGKSVENARSHGFFVYVRGRLINGDDEYFSIDSNKLWHGAFNRFRLEINIDRLDEELRSHRESVRQTVTLTAAQKLLTGIFNIARTTMAERDKEAQRGAKAANRAADSPESLAREPLKALIHKALDGKAAPKLIRYRRNLTREEQEGLLRVTDHRAEAAEGLIQSVVLTSELSQYDRMVSLDVESAVLAINSLHPFVAHFVDDYADQKTNLPLELFAVSEVLLEARMYATGLGTAQVDDVLDQRDELLRHLAKSKGKRNAFSIAQDLVNAATDKDKLESELIEAFSSMGYDALPLGGSGRPDGLAEAHLSATAEGRKTAYKLSLEAKSKKAPGTKVAAKTVGVSTLARHRKDYACDHCVVVGPDFPTGSDETAVVEEIKNDREQTGKTITLIRVTDLARLVRLVPAKRVGLDRLRNLFETCITPQESKAWINEIANSAAIVVPYREVLETIAAEQKDAQTNAVEFASLHTRMRIEKKAPDIARAELVELCRALSKMAPEFVAVTTSTVETRTRPDKIMDAISAMIARYPDEERAGIKV